MCDVKLQRDAGDGFSATDGFSANSDADELDDDADELTECNRRLPEPDSRSNASRSNAHQCVDSPIATESDDSHDLDECPQDVCARVGHEWQVVWSGFATSWGTQTVTSSWDECARCGRMENYWESELGV